MTNFKEASFFVRDGVTYYLKDERAREMLVELIASSKEKYGPDNPPPYPVTSVNGETGAVTVPTVTLPLAVSEGGTGATSAESAPFVRKVNAAHDVYISADYNNDQPITIWQNNADNSQRYGLVVSKDSIGLYDSNNRNWVWKTPLMTQSLAAWQINQGGTGATTAQSAKVNLGLSREAAQNFRVSAPSSSSSQFLLFSTVVVTQGHPLYGKELQVYFTMDGLYVWNNTDQQVVWRVNKSS